MNKTRWSILTAAVSLLFAFSVIGQGGPSQTFTQRYGQQLNLTDGQKKQIDEMDRIFQKNNSTFLESYQKTMAEYREARQANDSAKLEALKPKVDSLRPEMMKLRAAHEEKIAATFNDDQKAQWKKIKEEREARMKERMQHQ
ncbi:MAG: periplasmic protein CpxP/Spy [Thermoanaerobaculia bacterium]|jgi:Spy/CpxP family protein refolding chaperone|nr:periplasmic protein CpxP/Spy [Thermoanaerobaculia bacterium]